MLGMLDASALLNIILILSLIGLVTWTVSREFLLRRLIEVSQNAVVAIAEVRDTLKMTCERINNDRLMDREHVKERQQAILSNIQSVEARLSGSMSELRNVMVNQLGADRGKDGSYAVNIHTAHNAQIGENQMDNNHGG